MSLKTIIMLLAIPAIIVVLFHLDLHKEAYAPKDSPADETEH